MPAVTLDLSLPIAREGERVVIRFRDEETRNKARITLEDNQPDLALADQGDGTDLRLVATLKHAGVLTRDLVAEGAVSTSEAGAWVATRVREAR